MIGKLPKRFAFRRILCDMVCEDTRCDFAIPTLEVMAAEVQSAVDKFVESSSHVC